MKEVTLKRLVALEMEQGYIYEIEMDYIVGDSIEDVEQKIRWIINTDKSVLGIETICLVQDPVIRDVAARAASFLSNVVAVKHNFPCFAAVF